MEFVLVPKGKSWLGGGGGKPGDKVVQIKEDFYLGKYEVTQEEWEKVTGGRPSHFSRAGPGRDAVKDIPAEDLKRFPVEGVSWVDTRSFVKSLNAQVHEPGWVYRLPRQDEWEYACRGGPMDDRLMSRFNFYFEEPTNQLHPHQANAIGKGRTCKVGSYPPNRLGLHDMHGNVWEWCDDPILDPEHPEWASLRAIRGGCYIDGASENCRATDSHGTAPSVRSHLFGLRLARVPAGSGGE
jgi:formylglycine-generating enzyme required for sulfatase activity